MPTIAHRLFTILCGFFITALLIADIIGSKLLTLGPLTLPIGTWQISMPSLLVTAGILTFPLTFVLTDLINEFYGKQGARFITYLGLGMAVFTCLILSVARMLPAGPESPIPQDTFNLVFGLSSRMFIASLIAYLLSQILDIHVFQLFRRLTRTRMLWLRMTGSTVISQIADSFLFCLIAFGGKLPYTAILQVASTNYGIKFLVALALTPLCYLGHAVICRMLQPDSSTKAQMPVTPITA